MNLVQYLDNLMDKKKAMSKSRLTEMNNVGIVVEFLDNASGFFTEIGLKLQRRMVVEAA